MKTFKQEKERYLSLGYKADWGDGGINASDLCILQKTVEIIDPYTEKIIRMRYDYVILSQKHPTVHFFDVQSYSC